MASGNSEAGQEQPVPDLEQLLAVAIAARQKMRAEGGHSEADLPRLPTPSEAPYTEDEIDFEVPAYIESLIRAQAAGARSEEDSPPADNPSASSSSEDDSAVFEHSSMDEATGASIAALDDKVWDHIRQDEEMRVAASRVGKLGHALVAALNTPGQAGRQACASSYKDIKLHVDKLSEAMTRAETKGQVLYQLEVMKLVEESENL